MEVINKFYSSVHTTVSQLSGALPGNNVTREYEIYGLIVTAGIGSYWKIYKGLKKTTKQEVSIFVFEKKLLDKWPREEKESFLNILRHGVQQLTKVKHPRILTVQHPLEESRDCLAFAAEPVLDSLSNILRDESSQKKLFKVEVVYGFQQLIDGLMFLHTDAGLVHGNLAPESIVLNKHRSWKIFGLDFCNPKNSPISKHAFNNPLMHPNLDYLAPEVSTAHTNISESDIYSLGMLMFSVCYGKPVMQYDNNYDVYRKYATQSNQIKCQQLDNTPYSDLKNIVEMLLHKNPTCRPKLPEIIQLKPFHDVGVKTLNYLDTIYQWDNFQKSKFYKGLLQIIPNFPHRVNLHIVISHLVKEFVNTAMIPFVLPNILLIAKMSTQQEYIDYVLPHLSLVFNIYDPIQIPLILMQQMDVLIKLTPPDKIKTNVLPLLNKSLEFDLTELQQLGLQVLPLILSLIDYATLKNSVLLRLKNLCLKSTDISIKVKCLICIGKLLEHLDKWVLVSDILPFIEKIENREPAVIMAIVGIFKFAMTTPKLGISTEVMAGKCIPLLTPLCMENTLSVAQFNLITSIIKEMFEKVEKEQRMHLEQLGRNNPNFSNSCEPTLGAFSDLNKNSNSFNQWPVEEKMQTMKLDVFDTSKINKSPFNSNPLVLNRQLTTPACEFDYGRNYTESTNTPINYIYPQSTPQNNQIKLLEFNKSTNNSTNFSKAVSSSDRNSNSDKSNLILLSQQDILHFLK